MSEGVSREGLWLDLECTACGAVTRHDARWATVARHFFKGGHDDGWDGAILGRVCRCGACPAVDAYRLTGAARFELAARAGAALSAATRGGAGGAAGAVGAVGAVGAGGEGGMAGPRGPLVGQVNVGRVVLGDGTIARRPTQALGHARALAEASGTGEAWRRLGNLHERFDEPDAAAAAWRRALERDPAELEAAYSLALGRCDAARFDEAIEVASQFVARLGRGARSPMRLEMCAQMVDLLADRGRAPGDGRAIAVRLRSGKGGQVGARVELDGACDRLTLAMLLASDELVEARVVGPERGGRAASSPHVRGAKPGRNDPCSCGSGKKYKRCCGA